MCLYQSGTFEGNQARKLLQYPPMLLPLAEQFPEPARARDEGLIEIIYAFNEVVKACLGQNLNLKYVLSIQTFESAFKKLSISVTPKIHLIFDHLAKFLESKGSLAGLGRWSEQAMESVHLHHYMKIEWEKTKVRQNHSEFEEIFRKFIIKYNSKHV